MKKIIGLAGMFLLMTVAACKKGVGEVETPKQEQTKFPPPKWKADDTGKYPATMTAVITLPPAHLAHATEADELGAFINGECRGGGVPVKIGTATVYFILIRGLNDEQAPIVFKYYNAKMSHLFQTEPVLNFLIDAVYGTAEVPKQIALTPVQ